jgi:anaerobic magnesium-protoporphyrin IX monomethyl ester cyclase
VRVAIPNMARGCPFTCSFCSQWKFWRDYRIRDPKAVVDEIEDLVKEHDVGFFILADEEPTINRKKFIAFLRGADRSRPADKSSGASTPALPTSCATRTSAALPQGRPGSHFAGTEAAAQLKLDQFNKETKVEPTTRSAIRLLREADIFVEAQFIVGLDNETAGNAGRNLPDGVGLAAGPCQLGDVYALAVLQPVPGAARPGRGVRLLEKYNFVTPIMKPEAMDTRRTA